VKRYVCECCGASINPMTLKCEYCGTQYKDEFDNIVRVEMYTNPVDTYITKVAVDANFLNQMGAEATSAYVMDRMTRELANFITKNLLITAKRDLEHNAQIFSGTLKVIRPEQVDRSIWYN